MSSSHHDGINPYAAADLLRKAMLQNRSDEEAHDHIGSISTTPSGVATPNPNPTDKRMPGIMHSCFGQVRARSSTKSSNRDCYPSAIPAAEMHTGDFAPNKSLEVPSTLPTAPSSPRPQRNAEKDRALMNTSNASLDELNHEIRSNKLSFRPYPTPPISSPSSLLGKDGTDGFEAGAIDCGLCENSGDSFALQSADSSNEHLSTNKGYQSGNDVMPLRTRPKTAGLDPLTNTMTSPVQAAHLSNPTSSYPTKSPTTATLKSPSPLTSARSSLTSFLELTKLTKDVAALPRSKNTPPLTPRALSNDDIEITKKSSLSTTKTVPEEIRDSNLRIDKSNNLASSVSATAKSSAPVGPPRGKLWVKILEARGLRPSYDPYVVCVFEWNESIARRAKSEETDADKDDSKGKEDFLGAVPVKRSISDMGRSMAIPMKSRQSSTASLSDHKIFKSGRQLTDPKWEHEAVFDVLGKQSDIGVSIYDRSNHEAFLGHVKIYPKLNEHNERLEGWYRLEARDPEEDHVSGEIHLEVLFQKTDKKHYGPEDFQILKLIGKGTFGQVYQVRKKDTQRIYAMKVLSKKVIVQKKEVAHTLGERNILVRTAMADSPFIVGLKFSFQTPTDLYLVTGFMSGGELFWHLQKEGRFNEGRAKFYIAELILALQHLHQYDIVYRDLKPENILLDANGHIALCDFGLSKANLTKDDTTNTFCGTTEYLAPEVLLDEQGYTTMVDFWSLGVLVFEMCCGWSPFYADDTQQMYKNIAFGKVRFPRDALSTEGRSFVKGLLNRNPKHRLGAKRDAEELKAHPFFADTDWNALMNKMVVPPFKPKLKSVLDTSNFDPEFTNALQNSSSLNARAAALAAGAMPASTPLSPGMQANFKGFTFVDESSIDEQFRTNDLDTMEEGEEDDDASWEQPSNQNERRGDRMSGIIRTGDTEDYVFNDSHFDVE